MRILLVHQNFPGQFRELAPALMKAGHELRAISMRREPLLAGVRNWSYKPEQGNTPGISPWLVNTESAMLRGQAAARVLETMVREGWQPDLILGHTGWGELLFLKQVTPNARMLAFNELYYRAEGGDVGFDPEFPPSPDALMRLQIRNMHLTTSLLSADAGVTPTHWQASCFPDLLRQKIHVIHDGIQTQRLTPNNTAWIRLGREGRILCPGDEVVTFINRNLEPMRGYHQFMRCLPELMSRRPKARVVIVGGDQVSYGAVPKGEHGYKNMFLNEVRDRIDMERVHFVNRIPYETLVSLLRVSAAHVYLTVPFVLSWSMLEAMSLGALIIGSATPPVQEVIEHEKNGLLVDFFDPSALARTVAHALENPEIYKPMRTAARETVVNRYDFNNISLPAYHRLIDGQEPMPG